MRFLIVAATDMEVVPLSEALGAATERLPRTRAFRYASHDIDLLTTGVGMVATAAWCSRALAAKRYDAALNVGVCGTFDPSIALGTVVRVASDQLAELGAEDDATFKTAQELKLVALDEFPYTAGRLVSTSWPQCKALSALPAVDGITVNTVHGNEVSIAAVVERWHPQVESMEGAAFIYACLIGATPHAQIRAVSNPVERRNRSAWRLEDAIRNMTRTTLAILNEL